MTTLTQIPAIVRRAVRTGTNLHLVGEPGIGKTSVIIQTVESIRADTPDFWFDCLYTPCLSPIDFVAMIPDQSTGELKPYRNAQLPNAYFTPDLVGILFLGERDNADAATNKALQKYVNNEDMGGLRKPPGVIVVSDSNDISHRSGAVQQSLALFSRSRYIEVQGDPEVTLTHFARIGVYPFIQAYLSLRKENINTFATLVASREYRVWANPRSWERLSDSYGDADAHGVPLLDAEVFGDIGEAVGREFLAFLDAATRLTNYDDIVKSPGKAPLPDKMSDLYSIIAMLAHTVKAEDMAAVKTYVCRSGVEVQTLFLTMLAHSKSANKQACTRTAAYTSWFADPALRTAVLGV